MKWAEYAKTQDEKSENLIRWGLSRVHPLGTTNYISNTLQYINMRVCFSSKCIVCGKLNGRHLMQNHKCEPQVHRKGRVSGIHHGRHECLYQSSWHGTDRVTFASTQPCCEPGWKTVYCPILRESQAVTETNSWILCWNHRFYWPMNPSLYVPIVLYGTNTNIITLLPALCLTACSPGENGKKT